jgi:hypothetical protein
MIKHIVVFKYKQGTPEEQIGRVTDAFRDLKNEIPGILSFEHGANNSLEGKDLGFNHVYTLTFGNAQERDEYLSHAAHVGFTELLGRVRIVEDVLVFDYRPEA